MQKVINVMSIFSFIVSVGVVSGGAYIYLNREEIKENIKQQVIESATSGLTESLPGFLGGFGGNDDDSKTASPISIPAIPF